MIIGYKGAPWGYLLAKVPKPHIEQTNNMNYKLLLIFDFVKFSGQCPLCPKQLLLGPGWVQCQPDPGISRILNFWRYWSRWCYQSTKFSPYDFDDSSTHCDSICFHSIGLFSMASLRVRIIGILFQKLFWHIVRFFYLLTAKDASLKAESFQKKSDH